MAALRKITPEESWLAQRENAVAWMRVAFAAVAVFVIQLNPERVARFPELSAFSLGSFFIYSLVVLYLALHGKLTSSPLGILTNSLDVVWIAAIVFSTGGTRTPFFFYYTFPVITASIRWGLKGSIPVALWSACFFTALFALLSPPRPWNRPSASTCCSSAVST